MLTEPPLACGDAIDLLPALAQTTPIPLPAGSLDAVAALNYTGGTTGLPKGCIHTQGDMVDMAAAFSTVSLRADADTVMLSFYPQFWIAGENTGLIFPAFLGVPL
ncbi:AMP-binding protein, partial [Escherichia coli]